jgi:hypothetical protein
VRDPDDPDRRAGPCDGGSGVDRLLRAHTLQRRVDGDAVGQREDGIVRLLTPALHDVGRAERRAMR